ncbi:uncharacterized protein PG998_005282 [Apiospora kogelbergensis]|uniref:uncharacterized protein n=1 Tax=Apiospora kogelbergensis TaxID=1337665 RepID=UPI0031311EDC
MFFKLHLKKKKKKNLQAPEPQQQQQPAPSTSAKPPPAVNRRHSVVVPRAPEDNHMALKKFISSKVPGRCAGCLGPMELNADNVTNSVQQWWNDIEKGIIDV